MHKALLRKLRSPKLSPANLYHSVRCAGRPDVVFALWCHWEEDERNFGDALNPVMIRWISGCEVISAAVTANWALQPVHCVIGSILGLEGRLLNAIGRAPQVVWGAGFMYENDSPRIPPRTISAVRGPLSREIYLRSAVDCPEVYGDPALLCPRFHQPVGTRKYRLGIVPHYVDKGSPEVERLRASPDVRIIDIEGGILEVIDQINSCENVVSSSLHGMIVADAYGIPSAWVTMSGRVAGEGFKFRDYLASVGRDGMEAYPVVKGTSAADLEHQCNGDPIRIDLIRLWDVCPFRRADSGATAESASDEAVSRSAGASRTGQ